MGESIDMEMNGGLVNQYFFRGLSQGSKGVVMQGSVAMRVALVDEDDFKFQTVAGGFISLHPGDERNGDGLSAKMLELRGWGGLGVTTEYLQIDGLFYAYTSPNRSFEDVYELALVGRFFDDALWAGQHRDRQFFRGIFPAMTLAQEVDGARDGRGRGTYLELSTATRLRLLYGAIVGIDLVFPITVGVSLNDYYQIPSRPSGKVEGNFLGYAALGLVADFDQRWLPRRLGAWHGRIGCDALFPKAQKDGNVPQVGTVEAVVRGELVLAF